MTPRAATAVLVLVVGIATATTVADGARALGRGPNALPNILFLLTDGE